MTSSSSERILIVDDEPAIAQLYQLDLESQYDIEIGCSGADGLQLIAEKGPFAVVVSDMQMPEMNGAEFLAKVHKLSPQTVRMMLTGNDEQQVAVDAVNEGQIFRFLNKPCPASQLAGAIDASLNQYRLLRAEKELLDKTLGGSIQLLTDMLSVVKPLAFGRAQRVKRLVEQMCALTEVTSAWEVSLAAMLSQVGCVSLSDETLGKLHSGRALTPAQQQEFDKHPEFCSGLISKIPRLERIGKLIAAQELPYSELVDAKDPLLERAAFLKVALGFDRVTVAGSNPHQGISQLRAEPSVYAPQIVDLLEKVAAVEVTESKAKLKIAELRIGMILDSDVRQTSGMILITRGQEITEMLLKQLQRRESTIIQPIHVTIQRFEKPAA